MTSSANFLLILSQKLIKEGKKNSAPESKLSRPLFARSVEMDVEGEWVGAKEKEEEDEKEEIEEEDEKEESEEKK